MVYKVVARGHLASVCLSISSSVDYDQSFSSNGIMIRILVTTLALAAVTMAEFGGGHGGHVSHNVIHSGGHGGGYGGGLGGHGAHGGGGYGNTDHYAPAYYGFEYGVHDPHYGANFGHKEQRDGYKTSGSYFVDLPDGRRQKVTYTADEHGYHPIVTYEGYAQFPETKGHGGYHK